MTNLINLVRRANAYVPDIFVIGLQRNKDEEDEVIIDYKGRTGALPIQFKTHIEDEVLVYLIAQFMHFKDYIDQIPPVKTKEE